MPGAETIIQNVYVLSCDLQRNAGRGTVVLRENRIASVTYGGRGPDAVSPNAEIIDGSGHVLLPGFVDPHVHGESFALDLFTNGEPISRWSKNERFVQLEEMLHADGEARAWELVYRLAYASAVRGGVTYLNEFGSPTSDVSLRASVAALRRVGLEGMVVLHNSDQIEESRTVGSRAVSYALTLPAADELTTYSLQATLRSAKELGMPLVVHVTELAKDVETIRRNFRKSPLRVLHEFGIFGHHVVFAHVPTDDPEDLALLVSARVAAIVSPVSARRKAVDEPQIDVLQQKNIRPVFATDWGVSAPWDQLRTVELMSQVPVLDLFEGVTLGAARSIGRDNDLGSIETGKRASLQLVRCGMPEVEVAMDTLGTAEFARVFLRRVSSSDVRHVFVNGERVLRDGLLTAYTRSEETADMATLFKSIGIGARPTVPKPAPIPPDEPLGEVSDELGEEGFKVIKKGEHAQPQARILPLEPRQAPQQQLPATVRRVFGDDDL